MEVARFLVCGADQKKSGLLWGRAGSLGTGLECTMKSFNLLSNTVLIGSKRSVECF